MEYLRRNSLKEQGITLVALVVTIIVLLILAGITLTLALSNNGIMDRASYASNTWANVTKNENKMFEEIEEQIEELSNAGGDDSIGLTEAKIAAINSNTSLQKINYQPTSINTNVTIPGVYNGGAEDQVFTQSNLKVQSLEWYVLSADTNGVNLVSQPTSSDKVIKFKDAEGYDNCLYYLNEICTKLFTNEEEYGVDSSMVHALNLSDIKKAAEGMNGANYNFDTTFLSQAGRSTRVTNLGDQKTYGIEVANRKYPQLYGTGNVERTTNNPIYDEAVSGVGIPISGDRLNDSESASSLTINSTYCWYIDMTTCQKNLGTFASSGIGGKLFDSNGSEYWLASRCMNANRDNATFGLRFVNSGGLNSKNMGSSNGGESEVSSAVRCVVSIPASKINVSNNGTVTLK